MPCVEHGFELFGSGVRLLSWLPSLLAVVVLLGGYGWHARRTPHPLLSLSLFGIRTFRISVLGGFVPRLGVGGMPLLLPLPYQLGLGLPAWKSGLLMMPSALAAMFMKLISTSTLRRFGYRRVLAALVAGTIALFSQVGPATPVAAIVALGTALGLFNSLQFSSMNSMAYVDVIETDAAMATTIASTMQQMSMSFGVACGSLVVAFYLQGLPQTWQAAVGGALRHAFLTLAALTLVSSRSFRALRPGDGDSVLRGEPAAPN